MWKSIGMILPNIYGKKENVPVTTNQLWQMGTADQSRWKILEKSTSKLVNMSSNFAGFDHGPFLASPQWVYQGWNSHITGLCVNMQLSWYMIIIDNLLAKCGETPWSSLMLQFTQVCILDSGKKMTQHESTKETISEWRSESVLFSCTGMLRSIKLQFNFEVKFV